MTPPSPHLLGPEDWEELGEGDPDGLPHPRLCVKAAAVAYAIPVAVRPQDALIPQTITQNLAGGGGAQDKDALVLQTQDLAGQARGGGGGGGGGGLNKCLKRGDWGGLGQVGQGV